MHEQCTVSDFIVGQFYWVTTGFISVPVWTSDWVRNCDLFFVFFLLNELRSLTRLHAGGRLSDNPLTFVFYLVSFSKKELKETMPQQLLIFCRCWWSYALVDVHIVTTVICCWLLESRCVITYCMFYISEREHSVWLHSLTLLPSKCTVLIWKGQLFILISSFLKRCFNVIYISHWLFKLLNVCIII